MSAWYGSLRRGRWGVVALLVVGLLMIGLVGGATNDRGQAQGTITWDFTWAPSLTHSAAGGEVAALDMAARISAATGGRLNVVAHAPVGDSNEFQAVANGDVDIAWGWIGANTDELGVSAFLLGSSVGVMGPWGSAAWATDTGRRLKGKTVTGTRVLIDDLQAGTGVIVLSGPVPTVDQFAMCRSGTIIQQASDLQGVAFGASGNFVGVLNDLGASAQDIAPGDVHDALQSGDVDCAMAGSAAYNWDQGIQDVAPEWHGPGILKQARTGLDIFVNQSSFDALPRDLQVLLEGAIGGFAWAETWRTWDSAVKLWQTILSSGDVQVHQLPLETQQWVRDTTIWSIDQLVQGDADATAIWESQKVFDKSWMKIYRENIEMDYETYIITEGLSDLGLKPTDQAYLDMYLP